MSLEVLLDTAKLDPDNWLDFPDYGFRQYFLWKHPTSGASMAILEFEEGGGIPVAHSHASNQFMYCISGEYEYSSSGLTLRPGAFYMNPKDSPHGPAVARRKSVLLEIYDGPHYHEKPIYHTDETIGGFLAKSDATA